MLRTKLQTHALRGSRQPSTTPCWGSIRAHYHSHTCPSRILLHSFGAKAPQKDAVAARSTAQGSVLTGRELVLGSQDDEVFEPSNDLQELAAAQLHSLFQILARVSPSSSNSCKACVYARRADSLESPHIKLQRIACCKSAQQPPAAAWPPSTALYSPHRSRTMHWHSSSSSSSDRQEIMSSSNAFEELDELLILHRGACVGPWEAGSNSSSNSSSSCETEASLINEEVVLLPSSNLLVLPLAEAGVLVGLLVVEVASSSSSASSSTQQPQQQEAPLWEPPPVLGLSEDVLWALRMAVPPLAKACAMDLRTALAGAQQEARQRLARSLLLEARGPLKVLGTFGNMLAPRLKTGQLGEPESDMADGMLMQGQRLADVVAQLEAALRPTPRASAVGLSSNGSSWSDAQQRPWQQQQQLALPPAGMEDGSFSDEDDSWAYVDCAGQQDSSAAASSSSSMSTCSQPQQQLQAASRDALPPSKPPRAQLPPVGSSTSSSTGLPMGEEGHLSQQQLQLQQQQQQHVDLVPQPRTPESLELSSRNIRWSGVQPATPSNQPCSSTNSSSRSNMTAAGARAVYSPAHLTLDAAKTIDLEPMGLEIDAAAAASGNSGMGDTDNSSSGSGGRPSRQHNSFAARPQAKQRESEQKPVQQGVCNVIEVLSHLLSAAAQLAQVQGINLIVTEPLTLDDGNSPQAQGPAAASATAGSAELQAAAAVPSTSSVSLAAAGSLSSGSSSTPFALLPRPIRPLVVGVAGSVCRRVLGYCVDVALQCTPRGGQLCVTARESSGGVEVSLMHTGQAQPSRLHTATRAIEAAARGSVAAGVDGGGSGVSAGAAAVKQHAARRSSSTSDSELAAAAASSSSRWKRGMQELSSGVGLRGGASLITLDFARDILQSIGGRLSLTYPHHFINAITGQLEVGSNIVCWLPPAAT